MRTLHFMQLCLRRHCFTALRGLYELNMMLSYNHGPHFNVRERINGKMCQVFVDCTIQKFAQLKLENDFTLVFAIIVIPESNAICICSIS